MNAPILKIFIPLTISFLTGLAITPTLTTFLYKHKLWKKKVRSVGIDGKATPIFSNLHKDKEVGTPRMGGIVIWGSTLITTLIFFGLAQVDHNSILERFSFLSRNQTWLPFISLIAGSLVGLIDDILHVAENEGHAVGGGGLSLAKRLAAVLVIGLIGGWWFYAKLGNSTLWFPFEGQIYVGLWMIPLFMLVMIAMYSGTVIDGLDGLSGGIFTIMYASYSLIAFYQTQYDIAALCAVIAGATLAFLWFNIPPARFYMTETGTLGLTITLAVIAFLTDTVPVLVFIGFPLLAESGSDIIQLLSKKFRGGKKVFLVAPIHHHFEALGWPSYKVTMRFWIVGIITSIMGIVVAIAGK
ncbi:MAG: hypothetical protein WC764_03900 [Candidatus Paceibacterota bacterium]|jgi:phospho-N-acetylmuramoyl-pentapeptide-transferase